MLYYYILFYYIILYDIILYSMVVSNLSSHSSPIDPRGNRMVSDLSGMAEDSNEAQKIKQKKKNIDEV